MVKLRTLFFILFTCVSFSYQIEAKNHDGTCQQHRNYLPEIKTQVTNTQFFRTIAGTSCTDPVYLAHSQKLSDKVIPYQKRLFSDLATNRLRYYSQFHERLYISRLWSRGLFECAQYNQKYLMTIYPTSQRLYQEKLDEYEKNYLEGCTNLDTLQEFVIATFSDVYGCTYCERNIHRIYDHGLLELARGDRVAAFDLANELVDHVAKTPSDASILTTTHCLNLGISYSEALSYAKAIEQLSQAIKLDPSNHKAYLERAIAYFETSQFDAALRDFERMNEYPTATSLEQFEPSEFSQGLLIGLSQGFTTHMTELPMSLWNSAQGIGQFLWINLPSIANSEQQALLITQTLKLTQELIEYVKTHTISTMGEDISSTVAPELTELVKNWNTYDSYTRGEKAGHFFGKYGVDACVGYGSVKVVEGYRALKEVNAVCTLEAMASSQANKALIEDFAIHHARHRAEFFAKARICADKQGKHILGHRNYTEGKSILTHPSPEVLLEQHAGKGCPTGSYSPSSMGYQEIIDFGEEIGFCVDKTTLVRTPTTRGKIHYDSKGGAHIVPSPPLLK